MPICTVCFNEIGGIFRREYASDKEVLRCLDAGHNVKQPVCTKCVAKIKTGQKLPFSDLPIQDSGPVLLVVTTPVIEGLPSDPVGFVSAHMALGTGPISEFFSSLTDFFGEESYTYGDKIAEAEATCVHRLRRNALSMGADAIVGVQTTYTELSAGHGMLLVCMAGTAVKFKK